MKTILIALALIVMFVCNGCYAGQQDALNVSFQQQRKNLDTQCKADLTQWCKMQYAELDKQKAEELQADLNKMHHSEANGWLIAGIITAFVVVGGVGWYMHHD